MTVPHERRVATLWNLTWAHTGAAKSAVRCVVYQGTTGMELRLESAAGTILTEPFDMQPRAFARTRALRESLKRRGWTEG